MGRKTSSKVQHQHQPPPADPPKRNIPLILGVVAIVVIAVGVLVFRSGPSAEVASGTTPAAVSTDTASKPATAADKAVPVSAESQQRADAVAAFGPHREGQRPALPFR